MPGDFQHVRLLAVGCLEVLGEKTRDSNASPDLSDRTDQNSVNGDDRVNLWIKVQLPSKYKKLQTK